MSNLLILNQGTFRPDYLDVDEACRKTWGSDEKVDIIHYYGCRPGDTAPCEIPDFIHSPFTQVPILKDNILIVPETDTFSRAVAEEDHRPEKQIEAFKYVLNNFEFDYLYRTGCVCYIAIDRLLSSIIELPKRGVYVGNIWPKTPSRHYFVAGCNLIMSRDVMETAVENGDRYLRTCVEYGINKAEDLMMGALLTETLKYIEPGDRLLKYELVDLRRRDFNDYIHFPNKFNFLFNKHQANLIYKMHELIR